LSFKAPKPQRNVWNKERRPLTPPRRRNPTTKHQNAAGIARNALWRFLVMPTMIGHSYAPNFNGDDPHGVSLDSMGGFKMLGAQQVPKHAGGF